MSAIQNNFQINSFLNQLRDGTYQNSSIKQIGEYLHQNFPQIADDSNGLQTLDRIAEVIATSNLNDNSAEEVLQKAQDLALEAQAYLDTLEEPLTPTGRTFLSQILDLFISILESFLSAFGIADFFNLSENSTQSDSKLNKLIALLTFFSLVTSILIPLAGPILCLSVVGGALFFIGILSLIYPHIKPLPSQFLFDGENWSKNYEGGKLAASKGTQEVQTQLADGLKNSGTHFLLIGDKPQVKKELRALVRAIAEGVYPELREKRVIYFDTAFLVSLLSNADDCRVLSSIQENLGRHKDRFIIVFDNLHLAEHNKEEVSLSDQFSRFLEGIFPHVIGLATQEEFTEHLKKSKFSECFKQIVIQSKQEKRENQLSPSGSENSIQKLEQNLKEIQTEILQSEDPFSSENDGKRKQTKELQDQLFQQQAARIQEKQKESLQEKLNIKIAAAKKAMYSTALKLANLKKSASRKEIVSLALYQHYYFPAVLKKSI